MTKNRALWRVFAGAVLACVAQASQAQLDHSVYGVLDFSYGRFEPSGSIREDRFNSNSLTASFVGANLKYGLEGGWTPGVTLESFVRFQDLRLGRNDDDPFFSRKAFVSLASPYGTVSVGRLQSLLFDATSRFNALGNSIAFSPALRHIFASGNLEGVQGDFYWSRSIGYASPNLQGVTINAIYSQGENSRRGDRSATTVVYSHGLFAAELSAQHVNFNNGFDDPTHETAWQLGATYNFGFARLFGLYTQTADSGLDVRSHITSAGAAVPLGPGSLLVQGGYTTASGPAVDRRHTTMSAAYLFAYDSVTDLYVATMSDRIRGQTNGISVAAGVRFRF